MSAIADLARTGKFISFQSHLADEPDHFVEGHTASFEPANPTALLYQLALNAMHASRKSLDYMSGGLVPYGLRVRSASVEVSGVHIFETGRSFGSSFWDSRILDGLIEASYPTLEDNLICKYSGKLDLHIEIFKSRLDKHSSERLQMLLDCREGWDGGDAKPLSYSSLQKCSEFICKHDLRHKDVGVFMDSEGHLILNWPIEKDGDNNTIFEITFENDFCAVYVEGWDDRLEYSYASDDLQKQLHDVI